MGDLPELERGIAILGGGDVLDQSAVGVVLIVVAAIREGELSPMLKSVMLTPMETPEISTKLLVPAALKSVPHWQQLNRHHGMKAGARSHQAGTGHRRFR